MRFWEKLLGRKEPEPIKSTIQPMQINKELQDIQFGIICIMGVGGHKYAPPIPEVQLKQRAEMEAGRVGQAHVQLRVAEDIILRHNLLEEYRVEVAALDAALTSLRGGGKKDGIDVQGTGGEGDSAVGAGSVQDHQGERA